jgi:hypothetical protein
MLLEALQYYLEEVASAAEKLEGAHIELYEEEILTPERINLRIRVRFYHGCLLELNESVIYQDTLRHLGYRYHFQDKQNELIFRYDNTPHFPDLPTYPHHKHHPNDVIASERPSIAAVFNEAKEMAYSQQSQ